MKQCPEKVTTGGLTGQGFQNLLGRPHLAPLPLVLREAVQNSWDARRRRGTAHLKFKVRVRTLDNSEEKEFRKIFNQAGSIEPIAGNVLAKELERSRPICVLELVDYGTVGLSGSTRPDLPIADGISRFINFFFDIGRAHEESGDGGTYGFGRSSLYLAGRSSLILADTLADTDGELERRVMACRIGPSFEVSKLLNKGRYSGRHFWGAERGDVAQPLLRKTAAAVADRLGLPEREHSTQTGTTILIPWPVEGFLDGDEIVRNLLYHLWPKMVPRAGQPTIKFDVEVSGRRLEVPDPAATEEYRLFVSALKKARSQAPGPGVQIIETLRPRHTTGCLGVAEGVVRLKPQMVGPSDDQDADEAPELAINHIALMRPSELVVTYMAVPGTEPPSGKSWAGVFVCDDDAFVRTAFARAEPPAHDDWIADRLSDKKQKYIVKKTIQSLLPEALRDVLGIAVALTGPESDGQSLAGTSSRFSKVFLSGDGQGTSVVEHGLSSGGGTSVGADRRGERRARISAPVPLGLEIRKGIRIARFRAQVNGAPGSVAVIRATPSIHADGALETAPQGVKLPSVIGWQGGVADGDTCTVTLSEGRKDIEMLVALHDDYAVTLDCAVEEAKR